MIARLRGNLLELHEDGAVIDVQGVGYAIQGSANLLRSLPPVGGAVDLTVETLVREDSITLIGFQNAVEKRAFRLLQGIQGVGTRLALAVLSVLDPPTLERAVRAGDKAALTQAPGVGPRLAQRILTELEPRIGSLAASAPGVVLSSAQATAAPSAAGIDGAISALANLGYSRSEAYSVCGRAAAELADSADEASILRRALQLLAPAAHG